MQNNIEIKRELVKSLDPKLHGSLARLLKQESPSEINQPKAFPPATVPSEAELEYLVQQAQFDLAATYPKKTIPSYVRDGKESNKGKTIFEKVQAAECNLNDVWLAVRDGRRTLDEFKAAVQAYKEAHRQKIQHYVEWLEAHRNWEKLEKRSKSNE